MSGKMNMITEIKTRSSNAWEKEREREGKKSFTAFAVKLTALVRRIRQSQPKNEMLKNEPESSACEATHVEHRPLCERTKERRQKWMTNVVHACVNSCIPRFVWCRGAVVPIAARAGEPSPKWGTTQLCGFVCTSCVCQFQLFAYHYSMHASNHRVVKFFRKLFVFFFRDRQNDCIGTPRTKSDFTCHMLRDGLWLVGRRRGTLRCVCVCECCSPEIPMRCGPIGIFHFGSLSTCVHHRWAWLHARSHTIHIAWLPWQSGPRTTNNNRKVVKSTQLTCVRRNRIQSPYTHSPKSD